jgi:hypothetical protein
VKHCYQYQKSKSGVEQLDKGVEGQRAVCYWSNFSVTTSKAALLKNIKRLVEENLDYIKQAQLGAKNIVKILIFLFFLVLLHCSLGYNKTQLLRKYLVL